MPHRHSYQRRYSTLTLPDATGRYEVLQRFDCACGVSLSCTSYALNRGRHLSLEELFIVKRREQVRPQTRKGMVAHGHS